MSESNRRDFMKRSSASAAGAAVLAWTGRSHAAAPNSRINVGLIGCGGRGTGVAGNFNKLPNVEVTHVCDVHEGRLAKAAGKLNITKKNAVKDMRRILEDRDVDAVYIATPDHWHAPASILACEAGKHVYVEKPCSHTVREGRLLIEAARRHKRVVQHGTQVRSTSMMIEAIKLLREGIIGDVLVAKAWNIQKRKDMGHGQAGSPPRELDYDLWIGPVTMVPYQENTVGGWHWLYHFGTGGIGNDGIHDVDYAVWGLGVKTLPQLISSGGGKYFFDDDRDFSDTQLVTFEFPGEDSDGKQRMLIYEQRLWSSNTPSPCDCDSGVEYYGTSGRMLLSRRGKVEVVDESNRVRKVDIPLESQDTDAHVADFADAIRNDRRPRGDIELGHLTASLCHLGNLSTRLRRSLRFDPDAEKIIGDNEANAFLSRKYRAHWAKPAKA